MSLWHHKREKCIAINRACLQAKKIPSAFYCSCSRNFVLIYGQNVWYQHQIFKKVSVMELCGFLAYTWQTLWSLNLLYHAASPVTSSVPSSAIEKDGYMASEPHSLKWKIKDWDWDRQGVSMWGSTTHFRCLFAVHCVPNLLLYSLHCPRHVFKCLKFNDWDLDYWTWIGSQHLQKVC